MPIICWGELGKSANDPTTIDQEISAYILRHNVDPNAHGLADYALYNHRDMGDLDHPDESILNAKVRRAARTFDAIVDLAGNGDYVAIEDAIDGGARSIFVRAGHFYPSKDLVLTDGMILKGEGVARCLLHFLTQYGIKCQGSDGDEYHDIDLAGLHLIDPYLKTGNAGEGINLEFVNNFQVNFLKITRGAANPYSTSILYEDSCLGGSIEDIEINLENEWNDSFLAIHLNAGRGALRDIAINTIQESGNYYGYVIRAGGAWVIDNVQVREELEGGFRGGILVTGSNNRITNCDMDACDKYFAVLRQFATRNTFVGNISRYLSYYGIHFHSGANYNTAVANSFNEAILDQGTGNQFGYNVG